MAAYANQAKPKLVPRVVGFNFAPSRYYISIY